MMSGSANQPFRPNADPELRQQEMLGQVKKSARGVPRTFLSVAAMNGEGGDTAAEEGAGGGGLDAILKPSEAGFRALVKSTTKDKSRDLNYALRLTASSIPEHLQCGICHGIVKNAMLVPWDPEGHSCCETCIRDGLTKNGFTCPMSGAEGVSPDELFPNIGLRKAADAFVKEVMEKTELIEEQIEKEQKEEEAKRAAETKAKAAADDAEEYEDAGETRVVGKKTNKAKHSKKDYDLFGGDDEFGGDVFDVAVDEQSEEEEPIEPTISTVDTEPMSDEVVKSSLDNNTKLAESSDDVKQQGGNSKKMKLEVGEKNDTASTETNPADKDGGGSSMHAAASASSTKKEAPKRRGPPAGYVLGPAGGGGMMTSPPAGMGGMVPPPPPPQMNSGPGFPPYGAPMNGGRGFNPHFQGRGPPMGRGHPGDWGGRGPPMMQGRGQFPGRWVSFCSFASSCLSLPCIVSSRT